MTDTLEQVSVQRAELPTFGQPGMGYSEVLAIAQAEAEQAIRKYVGDFRYNADQADAVMHRVSSWANANRVELTAVLQDPSSDELPEQLRLALGVDEMRQFVVALYSEATRTLGPWASGTVPRLVRTGSLNEPEMVDDAEARLQIFGLIVKWDREGDLEMIFRPEAAVARAAAGLGLGAMHPLVVAAIVVGVIIALAVAAAAIYLAVSAADSVRRAADLMDKICSNAQKEGDQETTKLCLKYAAGIQEKGLGQVDWLGDVILAAAIIGGLYVLSAYGVPAMARGLKGT
jgi:hypothetical protein